MSTEIRVQDRKGKTVTLTIGLDETSLKYNPTSENTKTGDLPTQWIGKNYAESEQTCSMCPLMQNRTCYSQFGSPKIGFNSVLRGERNGKDRSLDFALEKRKNTAKYFRMAAIGDPGSIQPEVYKAHDQKIRESGLGVLAYTHQWYLPHAEFLKPLALASSDTWQDVKDAKKAGWRTALHVDSEIEGVRVTEKPQGTVDGVRYFLCPNQRGNKVQCNDCGLCDAKKRTNVDCIVFLEHGHAMKKSKKGV